MSSNSWNFELILKPDGELITEGPVWTGEEILFTHIRKNRILRYNPKTNAISVWRENTNRTNGLCFDNHGKLFGCCSGGRSIVRKLAGIEFEGFTYPERFIKIALKGLWGPIEVNGVQYDPSKGVPPMTGFGGLLNDNEMAAVLSYVRLSFGNNGAMITSEQVRKVREATKDRMNFYTVEEILKEHPLKN